ncbi:MAG TPA: saccharopine dehydrogenase NADP-binding domain-containing protein [Solirubrobacterales bacterium]
MGADRELDVAVFGATGFVGRLSAEYLAANAPENARIGLAGRSQERLREVRSSLGPAAAEWPLLVADSGDPGSLAELAEAVKVVATTVGPYRRSGLPLVEACASAGTDYADLTGEILFMREAIDRFDDAAAKSGARIVHSCGFDSIPSDLGVLLLHEAAQADDAGELEDVTLVVTGVKGGLSGGTFASLEGELDDVRTNPESRRIVDDPYALSPDRDAEADLGDQGDLRGVERNPELGWLGPFVMASINTRAVRRSNALADWAYGRRMRYREVMGFGTGPLAPVKAAGLSGGVWALQAGLANPTSRKLLSGLLPDPGEGPSEKVRRTGFFRIEIHARTSGGARYVCDAAAQGDPGYAATAVMLGESALCLALDDCPPPPAGVLTPATAMGTALVERLRAAGSTLEVRR